MSKVAPCYVVASLAYGDAKKAIEWLCSSFGFQTRLIVPGAGDSIAHSELSLGNAVVFVSSPKDYNGRSVQRSSCVCVYVSDPDSHYDHAVASGAKVVQELKDEEYGARGYLTEDPEGQLWYFSTYLPGDHWDESPPT